MRGKLWSIVSLVAVIVLTMPLAAGDTIGPAGDGRTHVTSSECTIQLVVPVQYVQLSQSPDKLTVPMNVQWFDERSGNSPEITHYFRENTSYDGGYYADTGPTTTGGMFQPRTATISFEVLRAYNGEIMRVTYHVDVHYTQNSTTLCSQTLEGWMHFFL